MIHQKGKKAVRRKVAVLVLEAFKEPRPNGLLALHKDDDEFNDCIGNLYWGTVSDNGIDMVRNGTCHFLPGDKHPNIKATDADVMAIRRLYSLGEMTQKEIGLLFGLGQTQVSNIVRGEQR